MSHREMLRLIFSIKNSLSDVVPSSPSWGRSYYTHWHLGWIASPLYQLCDAMPRGKELKHWSHFLHFATRSFETTISSRSRWCSLRRAESSRWSLSLPTCLAHSLQQGRKCRRISAKKKTTVNTFLSAETVSETINFAHLWTLILMLILLINDLNNSKNKINMNLQYVNTLSVDKPVFVNINIKILNTANLPSALLHHINTNLTVNSTDFKINMVVPSTYRRPARCLCASS